MATSKFPVSVTVNDGDPDASYVTLFIDVPGLLVKRALFGQAKPDNADVTVDIQDGHVLVVVVITGGSRYEYKKNLPEDIDASKSSYKVKKDSIVLKIRKREGVSWSAHARYLMTPE